MPWAHHVKQALSTSVLVTMFYWCATGLISYTLISEHQLGSGYYFCYPILMLLAFYSPTARIKKAAALVAMAIILIGGFIEPLELDAIEEAFILLPLLYLVLFPGTWWAIVVCGLLVALYLLDLPSEDLGEFTEDAIELVLITSFKSKPISNRHTLKKRAKPTF